MQCGVPHTARRCRLFMRSLRGAAHRSRFVPERQLSAAVSCRQRLYADSAPVLRPVLRSLAAGSRSPHSADGCLWVRSQSRAPADHGTHRARRATRVATRVSIPRWYPIVPRFHRYTPDPLAVIINQPSHILHRSSPRLQADAPFRRTRATQYGTLDESPQPHVYFNVAQRYLSGMLLQVRTAAIRCRSLRPSARRFAPSILTRDLGRAPSAVIWNRRSSPSTPCQLA